MVSVSRRSEGFSSFHMACSHCGRLTASHRAITTPCVTLSALVTRLSADRADTITTIMKETAAKSATMQLTTLSPARDSVTIVFSNRGCCCIEVVRPGYFPERNLQTIKSERFMRIYVVFTFCTIRMVRAQRIRNLRIELFIAARWLILLY